MTEVSIHDPEFFIVALAIGSLGLGLTGLFFSTLGSPLVALAYGMLFRRRSHEERRNEFRGLDILIPAHNEQEVLLATLESVRNAMNQSPIPLEWRIVVGLDHCTDRTGEIADEFSKTAPLSRLENPGQPGKWWTLVRLIRESRADWVALVDAGSVWSASLIADSFPLLRDPRCLGIAPSYMPVNAGLAEKLNWKLERFLKTLENLAGGPISVHGATVLYHRESLLQVLNQLENVHWLNDDVVIPLSLRLRFPAGRIHYLHAREEANPALVSDLGVQSRQDLEFRRRRRMVLGNLQWIRWAWLPNLARNPQASWIALRRLFRLAWAYWVLLIGAGTVLIAGVSASHAIHTLDTIYIVGGLVGLTFLTTLIRRYKNIWAGRLWMAFLSGLRLPIYWGKLKKDGGVSWS